MTGTYAYRLGNKILAMHSATVITKPTEFIQYAITSVNIGCLSMQVKIDQSALFFLAEYDFSPIFISGVDSGSMNVKSFSHG